MNSGDLRALTVDSLIVHEIPSRLASSAGSPLFSDVESPLDAEVRNFFQERLRHTLSQNAFPAVFMEDAESPVPALVQNLIGKKPPDFVEASKAIAQQLFHVQTGVTSPGLLVVMKCQLGKKNALAILKLEKEHGVRVENQTHKGKSTLSVLHIRDLMLTQKTRVFKTGLFVQTPTDVEILTCDLQRPATEAIASFFLQKFLGCELAEKPNVLTRDFMTTAERWINEEVEDAATKSRYQIALLAEMESNRNTISPAAFATSHLEVKHRAPFVAALKAAKAPSKPFPKDVELVRNKLKRIQYAFTNKMTVACPPEAIGNQVMVEDLADGATRIQLTGELENVSGRGR